jgi:hydroxymethylpyrimidine/phosphomethylpyrimidine kinase
MTERSLHRSRRVANALTIAGSDPSGGAGIQADLKTFSAFGVYATSVLTALTAQNTRGVTGIHRVPADFVTQQLDTLVSDVRIDGVKIGMLGDADIVKAVAAFLDRHTPPHVVLDPVMVATSGDRLLQADAIDGIRSLLPRVALVTPNLAEAAILLDEREAVTLDEMSAQAVRLRALGAPGVLLKGGHLAGPRSVDLLVTSDGEQRLDGPRVDTPNTHGTGCSLSSAIAALLARGLPTVAAVTEAKRWLTGALAASDLLDVGHGHGPVHHFHEIWSSDDVH